MYDKELYHYGVKGMKWGKKKAKNRSFGGPMNGKLPKVKEEGDQSDPTSSGAGGKFASGRPVIPLINTLQEKRDARTTALRNIPSLSSKQLHENQVSYNGVQRQIDERTRAPRERKFESYSRYRRALDDYSKVKKPSLKGKAKSFISRIRKKIRRK